MKRPFLISGTLAGLAAIPYLLVLLINPGERARATDVFVVVLGGLLMLALARITAGNPPSRRASLLDEERNGRVEVGQLPELSRIEREVVLATGSEFDQHLRIKPLLRDIVEHRLWARRGIDLRESPEKAREALGEELWELVRAGPPDPNSRYLRALDLRGLNRALDRIEGLR